MLIPKKTQKPTSISQGGLVDLNANPTLAELSVDYANRLRQFKACKGHAGFLAHLAGKALLKDRGPQENDKLYAGHVLVWIRPDLLRSIENTVELLLDKLRDYNTHREKEFFKKPQLVALARIGRHAAKHLEMTRLRRDAGNPPRTFHRRYFVSAMLAYKASHPDVSFDRRTGEDVVGGMWDWLSWWTYLLDRVEPTQPKRFARASCLGGLKPGHFTDGTLRFTPAPLARSTAKKLCQWWGTKPGNPVARSEVIAGVESYFMFKWALGAFDKKQAFLAVNDLVAHPTDEDQRHKAAAERILRKQGVGRSALRGGSSLVLYQWSARAARRR